MWGAETPHFFDFGIFGHAPEPQNQYYLFLENPRHFKITTKNQEKSKRNVDEIRCWENSENIFKVVWAFMQIPSTVSYGRTCVIQTQLCCSTTECRTQRLAFEMSTSMKWHFTEIQLSHLEWSLTTNQTSFESVQERLSEYNSYRIFLGQHIMSVLACNMSACEPARNMTKRNENEIAIPSLDSIPILLLMDSPTIGCMIACQETALRCKAASVVAWWPWRVFTRIAWTKLGSLLRIPLATGNVGF